MLIRQTTCFSSKQVIRKTNTDINVYPLNSENSYLFFGARYAIWAGVKILGITPRHNILLPSYNCGTEIDPILDQEVQIKYYQIKGVEKFRFLSVLIIFSTLGPVFLKTNSTVISKAG